MQGREAHLPSCRDALGQPTECNAPPGTSVLASEQLHNVKPSVWGLEGAELYQLSTYTQRIAHLSVWFSLARPGQPVALNWCKKLRKAVWTFLLVQLTLCMQLTDKCYCSSLTLQLSSQHTVSYTGAFSVTMLLHPLSKCLFSMNYSFSKYPKWRVEMHHSCCGTHW